MLFAVVILKFYYNETLIKIGKIGLLIVLSDSMEPEISKKEMIIIKEQEKYDVRDIITYKDKFGDIITHRIVEIDGDIFFTKGDSNTSVDEAINKSDIQGKVVLHSSILGFISLNILKPIIIIICLGYLFKFIKYFICIKILLKICKYC